jgi:hypothetical protein
MFRMRNLFMSCGIYSGLSQPPTTNKNKKDRNRIFYCQSIITFFGLINKNTAVYLFYFLFKKKKKKKKRGRAGGVISIKFSIHKIRLEFVFSRSMVKMKYLRKLYQ